MNQRNETGASFLMENKFFLLFLCLVIATIHSANAEVPASFILGDSTADVGTNNFLPGSKARADFPHNGIDFPFSRPTGRFSNGLNTADFLAKFMGFKRSPSPFFFLANQTRAFQRPSFRGVNFASGGSGILDATGKTMSTLMNFGKDSNPNGASLDGVKNVITLKEQMEQLSSVYSSLVAKMGKPDADAFISKSLFFISIGSNDIFGYYHSGKPVPKEEFLSTLGQTYETHLRSLLNLGARKIGVVSVAPIGCCPSQREFNATGGCLEELNDLARSFHSVVHALLMKLGSEYKDLKYSLGNAYEMTINVIYNPSPFGFTDVENPCCGDGKTPCIPTARYCSDRREYLFWDLYHPTMQASKLAAFTLYSGEQRFVAPINFKQLIEA